MRLRSAAIAILIFTVTAVFAQDNAPASAPAASTSPQATQPPVVTRRWGKNAKGSTQAAPVNTPSFQQRVQDLQGTVDKMHVVLKQMRIKSSANAKDPMVKANLEMWELMVGQLQKQLEQLKLAEASREDMEARRAAMYKQAEIKSQAAAKAAQQTMFSQQPTGTVRTQEAVPGPNGPAPAASQTPTPGSSANTAASPN